MAQHCTRIAISLLPRFRAAEVSTLVRLVGVLCHPSANAWLNAGLARGWMGCAPECADYAEDAILSLCILMGDTAMASLYRICFIGFEFDEC